MQTYQKEFLQFIYERGALRFGEFQTKSGRLSPYFFNAGGLFKGSDLVRLGEVYASAMQEHFATSAGIIYGPAYKGIPLSVLITAELARRGQDDIGYCFNRKEAKDHGEKGLLVGQIPQAGDNIVVVDDVITAGTSIRETMELLKNYEGINIKGILVAVDRQEKGTDCEQSATQQVAQDYGLPVHAIANISHIIELLESGGFGEVEAGLLERVKTYRDTYGVN
jgi:orotate phosphoribosyltransferase